MDNQGDERSKVSGDSSQTMESSSGLEEKSSPQTPEDTPDVTTKQPSKVPTDTESCASTEASIPSSTTSPTSESKWWSGSSWSGWYESALTKSSVAFDYMKKDLSEVKDTFTSESINYINSTSNVVSSTVSAVSSTANYIKETVESLVDEEDNEAVNDEKKDVPQESRDERVKEYPDSLTIAATEKLSSVFNSILESILPTGPDDSDEDCVLLPGNYLVPKSRWDQLVRSIQNDPQTYCHEPVGPPDDYESWLEKFNLLDHDSDVRYLLENSETVNAFYKNFVPSSLTSDEFWHRYFYRIHQLQEVEVVRAKLLYGRAERDSQMKKEETTTEEEITKSEPSFRKSSSDSNIEPQLKKEPLKVAKLGAKSARNLSKPTPNKSKTQSSTPVKTSAVSSPASSVKSAASRKSVGKSGKSPSPTSSESTVKSSSEASTESWEKTDMNDIVDEVAKKLEDKLNAMPEPKSDEELNEWEFE